jgi:hypothetical protein
MFDLWFAGKAARLIYTFFDSPFTEVATKTALTSLRLHVANAMTGFGKFRIGDPG